MEIRIVKTFLKVAETPNITQSAELLGYSQGSVTAHIQQLEKELNVKLFDRIGRGVQFTEAGRRFLPYAVNLVKASEDAESFSIDATEPEGELIIEASSSVSIGILPKLLLKFQEKYPGIRLKVKTSDNIDIMLNSIRQNRVDFGLAESKGRFSRVCKSDRTKRKVCIYCFR